MCVHYIVVMVQCQMCSSSSNSSRVCLLLGRTMNEFALRQSTHAHKRRFVCEKQANDDECLLDLLVYCCLLPVSSAGSFTKFARAPPFILYCSFPFFSSLPLSAGRSLKPPPLSLSLSLVSLVYLTERTEPVRSGLGQLGGALVRGLDGGRNAAGHVGLVEHVHPVDGRT